MFAQILAFRQTQLMTLAVCCPTEISHHTFLGKTCFPSWTGTSDAGWIYYLAIDMQMPNVIWKWRWIDAVFFCPEKEKQRICKLRGHPQRTDNHFLLSLRDRTNLQMQLRLSLVSPRGSTHHLYGSAPSKLCYIRLQRSSPPCLSGLTLLLSQQHSAEKLSLRPQCQNTQQLVMAWRRTSGQTLCLRLINGWEIFLGTIRQLSFVTVNMPKYPEVLFTARHIYS